MKPELFEILKLLRLAKGPGIAIQAKLCLLSNLRYQLDRTRN